MTKLIRTPVVIITDGPVGFHVNVEPETERSCEKFFEDHDFACGYARGLAIGLRCKIEDRSSEAKTLTALSVVTVEQLNASQWHALVPGERASGVGNWVEVVTYALVCGALSGCAVETVALDGERLQIARGEPWRFQSETRR